MQSVRSGRRNSSRRLFGGLAAVQLLLLLDMLFDWRWKLHGFWVSGASALGVYGDRRLPQTIALGVLAIALILASLRIRSRLRGNAGAAIAATGTLLSVGIWCCECISLHAVDHIFYAKTAGLMNVGFLWLLSALVTCFGAWLDYWNSRVVFGLSGRFGSGR